MSDTKRPIVGFRDFLRLLKQILGLALLILEIWRRVSDFWR